MVLLFAQQREKVVRCVACLPVRDDSHEHVTTMTVRSMAGNDRRTSLSDAVAQLRHPLGERYLASSPKSGPRTPVVLGPCPVCSHEPHVRLEGGGRLEDLPRCG